MGEPAKWQQRVEEFVLGKIGDPPARVLEVGCGEGELARAMARTGHSVTAIDPRVPEGTIFRRVRIEEFSDPGPFDYVVTSLSLHHVEDLRRIVDKIADLLRVGGPWSWSSSPGAGSMRPRPSEPWSGSLLPLRRRSHRGCSAAAGNGRVEAKEGPEPPRWRTSLGGRARRGCTDPGRCSTNSDAASTNACSSGCRSSTRTSVTIRRRRTRARP
jgi:hypothetical protein